MAISSSEPSIRAELVPSLQGDGKLPSSGVGVPEWKGCRYECVYVWHYSTYVTLTIRRFVLGDGGE